MSSPDQSYLSPALRNNADLTMAWFALIDAVGDAGSGQMYHLEELWSDLNKLLMSIESSSILKRKGTLG